DARSWAKPPSIALATPMLGTEDDAGFLAANVFVEKYARLIRNISVEKATGLIDFNRYWRLLRDGEDELITEYKYVKITDLTFRSGQAAETVDANTLENDSATTETFYGSTNETYLEAN